MVHRFPVLFLLVVLGSCQAAPVAVAGRSSFPEPPVEAPLKDLQTAVFAGGCFWGIEAVFERLKGVSKVVSGYTGGTLANPSYEEVSSGTTGHAEAVEVTYDPQVITYGTLLKVLFSVAMDPTQKDYQGPDRGTQYRSGLFVKTPAQKDTAEAYLATLSRAKLWKDPLVTEVTGFTTFWPAEEYHQDFIQKHPNQGYVVQFDLPKIRDLERSWPDLVKPDLNPMTWSGLRVHRAEEVLVYPVVKSESQWKAQLSAATFEVMRHEGTEAPFSGALVQEHRPGTYLSAATGQPLFRSEDKFESGTGWPSFSKLIDPDAVILRLDTSLGMERVEVEDSQSGSHLGHVFDDGPGPTGLRYCINSVALTFVPD